MNKGRIAQIARPATQEGVEGVYQELKAYLDGLTVEEHSHTYITQSMNNYSIVIFIHTPPFSEK